MMIDSYHIYFKGEILFKNLSKDEFEFVWEKLYTSYINVLGNLVYIGIYTFSILSIYSI